MSNPYFRFKQFTVWHDRCAMKVGTDGVLIGAWCDVAGCRRILDVGCGTGLIALMAAQRTAPRCRSMGWRLMPGRRHRLPTMWPARHGATGYISAVAISSIMPLRLNLLVTILLSPILLILNIPFSPTMRHGSRHGIRPASPMPRCCRVLLRFCSRVGVSRLSFLPEYTMRSMPKRVVSDFFPAGWLG